MYFFCMRIAVKTLAYYKSIKLFSSVNNGFHIFGCLHQTRMGIKAYSTWNSAFHRLHDTHTHTHVLYIYTEQRHVRHDWGRAEAIVLKQPLGCCISCQVNRCLKLLQRVNVRLASSIRVALCCV